jgi:hypothetical protein
VVGAQGPPGVSGYEIVPGPITQVNADAAKASTAECPVGKVLVGGGYWISPTTTDVIVVRASGPSLPDEIPRVGWAVLAQRMGPGTENWAVRSWAFCASVSP